MNTTHHVVSVWQMLVPPGLVAGAVLPGVVMRLRDMRREISDAR